MAEYPRRDKLTGDAAGCEHQGKPSPPMSEGPTSTRGVTWLPGGSSSGTKIPYRCVSLTTLKPMPQPLNPRRV